MHLAMQLSSLSLAGCKSWSVRVTQTRILSKHQVELILEDKFSDLLCDL